MRVTIHQPEHMPWLGFFHKINMADVYVVLDNVQYRRRYFQNRNKIRTKQGWQWATVPLEKENRAELLIKDVKIFREDLKWKHKNLEKIYHNYCKAKYFTYFWGAFEAIYNRDFSHLRNLNLQLLNFFFEKLGIKIEICFVSDMNVSGKREDLILNICKAIGAKTYMSGISGKEYLDLQAFSDNGINVIIQQFHHPIYEQLYEPFLPCMSIIDLLFNHGDRSLDIINGFGVPVMDKIFL